MISRVVLQVIRAALLLAMIWPTSRAMAQHYSFASYGETSGLSNLGITCLVQDRIGFLLACTDNGIYRFDGRNFLRLDGENGLPPRGISQILQLTADGRLLTVMAGRMFMAEDTSFPQFEPVAGDVKISTENRSWTARWRDGALLENNNRLFLITADATGKATSRPFISPMMLSRHAELRTLNGLAVGGDDIWFGCAEGRLCRLRCPGGGEPLDNAGCDDLRVYGPQDGVKPQDWAALLVDHTGTLWARAPDRLVSLRRGDNAFVEELLAGGVGRYVGRTDRLTLAENPRGQLITQGATGIAIRTASGWLQLDRDRGLPDGDISSVLIDRDGTLWLGLRGQGLFRAVSFGDWQNWTITDGLDSATVWEMARTGNGNLWLATDSGVDAVDPAHPRPIIHPPLNAPAFAVAQTRSGAVWSANLAGRVQRVQPSTGSIDAQFTAPIVELLAPDRFGGLLMGTRGGLFRIPDPDTASPHPPVLVPGTVGRINAMTQDIDGTVWLAVNHAILKLDPTGRQPPVTIMHTGTMRARALLFAAPGDLWIGSDDEGLQRLIMTPGRPPRLEAIESAGAAASQVIALVKDARGWIWVATERGLNIWNGAEWQWVNEQDGLLSNDLDQNALLADPDGSMWFGTGHGLSHLLDPSGIFTNWPLHPVITESLLDGQPIRQSTIPWSDARLTFRFGSLDFRWRDSVRFRYRLKGLDRDWVETDDDTVRYPSLPYGHITFTVVAVEPLRHLVSAPVSVEFDVTPPWWATVWFRILAVLLLLMLASIAWRLSHRILLARQKQLGRLVAIRTAEIAAANAALKTQAERDTLTGLLNRATATFAIDTLLDSPSPAGTLAVVLADLDHFKAINDQYGHFGGDAVLREVSARLAAALRPGEIVGRYGGEEFVLVLPRGGDPIGRLELMRNAVVETPIRIDDQEISVTFSFGLAVLRPGEDRETILRRADRLLYAAKAEGRDRIAAET